MKIYKAYLNHKDELKVDQAEAKVTAKQIMLDDTHAAWHYGRRFNKRMPLHESPRDALKAFMEKLVQDNRYYQSQIRKNQLAIEKAREMMA